MALEYGPDGEPLTVEDMDRYNAELGLRIHETDLQHEQQKDYSHQIEQGVLDSLND